MTDTTERSTGAAALDGRTSVAQKLLRAAGDTRQDFDELKGIMTKLYNEWIAVKEELVNVKTELGKVKQQTADELRQFYERLDAVATREDLQALQESVQNQLGQLSAPLELPSGNRSYADAARTPPSSQPTNLRTLSSSNTTPSRHSETIYCTIETSRVMEEN